MLRYYKDSLIFTALCLGLAVWLGLSSTGSFVGMLGVLWIVVVLGVLEISLSFDNAVVNATVLRTMDPIWRKRFLTWGIIIAVFGMRIVFPLLIVAIAARLGPIDAVKLAATEPETYERYITAAHVGISGFGGAFLAMVGLTFFFDEDKEVHWIGPLERPFAGLSRVAGLAVGVVLLALYGISRLLSAADAMTFLVSGIFGLLAYIAVEAFNAFLEGPDEGGGDDHGQHHEHGHGHRPKVDATAVAARGGLGAFLYLEVLDASFSFDGVIGAFALSNNLFIIALGLGIGAMFVRSMTVALTEQGTLTQYRYLEHGAFYAIIALAAIMLLSARYHIPETITGLIGAALIGIAFWASVRANRADGTGGAVALEDAEPVEPTGERIR